MSAADPIEIPILVVGGGPVGMLAGILCAQQGLANRIVERRPGPHDAPAAHVLNARSFEICRQTGIDMQALRAAWKEPGDAGLSIFVTTLAGEELGRLPFEQQGDDCLRHTPTPLRNLAQHRFERILLEAVRKTPGTTIHHAHQWETSEQDATGVTSRIRDLASDGLYTVRSRYVVAADGAASRVRKSLGIAMEGPPKLRSFVMIHFEANLRELVADKPGVLYWLNDPEAPGTLVAHDLDREWVYMYPFDSDRETQADYDDARCRALVQRALGTDRFPVEILHRGDWTMSAQVAERFRAARIFLVGDAAHRFPPTGGLGLNSGLQDAHGLAWKLGAVEAGWAPTGLLDSYETERRAVVRNNSDQSLRNVSRLLQIPQALGVLENPTTAQMEATLADPAGRRAVKEAIAAQAEHFDMLGLQLGYSYEDGAVIPDGSEPPARENPVREYVPTSRPGARMPHAWVHRDGERISTLDLLRGDGFSLVTGADGDVWARAVAGVAATSPVPLTHVPIGGSISDPDGHWADVCGIGPAGALLVRPDQHVAWRTQSPGEDAASDLRTALDRILGPTRS